MVSALISFPLYASLYEGQRLFEREQARALPLQTPPDVYVKMSHLSGAQTSGDPRSSGNE